MLETWVCGDSRCKSFCGPSCAVLRSFVKAPGSGAMVKGVGEHVLLDCFDASKCCLLMLSEAAAVWVLR